MTTRRGPLADVAAAIDDLIGTVRNLRVIIEERARLREEIAFENWLEVERERLLDEGIAAETVDGAIAMVRSGDRRLAEGSPSWMLQ